MAASDTKKTEKKEKKSGGRKLSAAPMILIIVVLGVVIKTTIIFILLAMMPSIVAWYVDMRPGKPNFRTVMACNLSGVIPYALELIGNGNQTSQMLRLLTDPPTWFLIYASAGIGWLLVWGCPYAVELYLEVINSSRIAKLESMQRKLVDEWGPEVKRARQG